MPVHHLYPSYRDTVNRIGICLCIMLALMQGTALAWTLLTELLSAFLPANSAYFAGVLIETVSYLSYFLIPAALFVPLSRGRDREPVRFGIRMPAIFPLLILSGLAAISAASQVNAWLMTLIGYGTGGILLQRRNRSAGSHTVHHGVACPRLQRGVAVPRRDIREPPAVRRADGGNGQRPAVRPDAREYCADLLHVCCRCCLSPVL